MKKAKLWCGAFLTALLSATALTGCGGGGSNGKCWRSDCQGDQ